MCPYLYLSLSLNLYLYFSGFPKHGDVKQSGEYGLRVDVSDQVCEAEKDEDGHALNLKGENYFHLP